MTPGSPSPTSRSKRSPRKTAGTRKQILLVVGLVGTLAVGGFAFRELLPSGEVLADSTHFPATYDLTQGGQPGSDSGQPGQGIAVQESLSVQPVPEQAATVPPVASDTTALRRRRDSMAAVARRRDSAQTAQRLRDSITAARRRDSIAAATPIPPRSTKAWVKIGTRRTPPGLLTINGVDQGVGEVSLRYIQVTPGPVHIVVQPTAATGCVPFDSSISVAPGDTIVIGYRNPKCAP